MKEYKQCYIAVIDLLGFKAALELFGCDDIASIFDEINTEYAISHNATDQPIIEANNLHVKVMSDTICIYVETSVANALTALIATCDYLQVRLLRLERPILSRGAIVKGQLYHKDDVLFGPGFVKAYLLEEKEAVYPRIIIDEEALAEYECTDYVGQDYIDRFVIKDFDGKSISDYLYLFYGLSHDQDSWIKFACSVCTAVEQELNEGIRQKYQYIYDNFPRIQKKLCSSIKELPNNV